MSTAHLSLNACRGSVATGFILRRTEGDKNLKFRPNGGGVDVATSLPTEDRNAATPTPDCRVCRKLQDWADQRSTVTTVYSDRCDPCVGEFLNYINFIIFQNYLTWNKNLICSKISNRAWIIIEKVEREF